jgi:hypothetical protein
MLRYLLAQILRCKDIERYRRKTVAVHDGIRIVDASFRPDRQNEFVRRMKQALDFIARADGRRYARIRKHVRFIVHRELVGAGAKYKRLSRACLVDLTQYDFLTPRTVGWFLAGSLVHEATHGRIGERVRFRRGSIAWLHDATGGKVFRRGVTWNPENRWREEKMCLLEEARFARRVDRVFGEAMEKVRTDPARQQRILQAYQSIYTKSVWRVCRDAFRRFRESQRVADQAVKGTKARK